MEKLLDEDAFVPQVVVSKINEIVEAFNALAGTVEKVDERVSNHWMYHRHKAMDEAKNGDK
jgi:hypothetical protein